MFRPAGDGAGRAFVKLDADGAGDVFLRMVDQGLQRLTLGREPEAIIDQFSIARHDAVFQMTRTCIQRDLFDATVGFQQDGAAGVS